MLKTARAGSLRDGMAGVGTPHSHPSTQARGLRHQRVFSVAALAVGMLAVVLPRDAAAMGCSEDNLLYEKDPENRGEYNDEFVPTTLRFEGGDVVINSEGHTTRYAAAGSAGSGIPVMVVQPEDDADPVTYRILDLSRVAARDGPDHVLIFNEDLYWPTCTE